MKKQLHTWNVITVTKFTYPRPEQIEFQVQAKNLLGATMKANNKMKELKLPDKQKIQSVYWLDPRYLEGE